MSTKRGRTSLTNKWKIFQINDFLILFKSRLYPVNNYGGRTTRIIEITSKSSIIVSIHQIERRNFIDQLKTRISNLEYTGMFMNLFDNVGHFRFISRDKLDPLLLLMNCQNSKMLKLEKGANIESERELLKTAVWLVTKAHRRINLKIRFRGVPVELW